MSKNIKRGGLTILAGLLLIPAAGWAQAPEERIQTAFEQAEERGIPAWLLESKLAEGQAKGVPADRLAQAVEHRLEGLTRAAQALEGVGSEVDGVQLGVGADALGAGVREAVLTEIGGAAPTEHRAVAIAALTHLVESGVVPDEALLRVHEALARGPSALAELPGAAAPPVGTVVPGRGGPPSGVEPGPPSPVPAPGQGGPPEPPTGGPPSGPPGGPPGGGG